MENKFTYEAVKYVVIKIFWVHSQHKIVIINLINKLYKNQNEFVEFVNNLTSIDMWINNDK